MNKTTDTFYDNSFDLIRMFAALQVFIGHYLLWYHLSLGTFGDRLFNTFQGVPVLFAGGVSDSSFIGKKQGGGRLSKEKNGKALYGILGYGFCQFVCNLAGRL